MEIWEWFKFSLLDFLIFYFFPDITSCFKLVSLAHVRVSVFHFFSTLLIFHRALSHFQFTEKYWRWHWAHNCVSTVPISLPKMKYLSISRILIILIFEWTVFRINFLIYIKISRRWMENGSTNHLDVDSNNLFSYICIRLA